MPIYRVVEPELGRLYMREWRRRLLGTVGLLLVTVAACAIGLVALDSSGQPLPAKLFRGLWNALNLVTTLGDLTELNKRASCKTRLGGLIFPQLGGSGGRGRPLLA